MLECVWFTVDISNMFELLSWGSKPTNIPGRAFLFDLARNTEQHED